MGVSIHMLMAFTDELYLAYSPSSLSLWMKPMSVCAAAYGRVSIILFATDGFLESICFSWLVVRQIHRAAH